MDRPHPVALLWLDNVVSTRSATVQDTLENSEPVGQAQTYAHRIG
jgi:hypothetical protein